MTRRLRRDTDAGLHSRETRRSTDTELSALGAAHTAALVPHVAELNSDPSFRSGQSSFCVARSGAPTLTAAVGTEVMRVPAAAIQCYTNPMARLFNVTFGARDPIALGRFWSQALAFEVVAQSVDLVRLASSSDVPDVLLLRVSEVSPTSTLHLDLAAADPEAEVERLVALGARPVDVGPDGEVLTREANGLAWFVLTDPEGNEFCIGSEP